MPPKRVAISGASGLIGTAVTARLRGLGHDVSRLVRSREEARAPDAVYWRPDRDEIDADGIAGHDAVINLAGENIFGWWSEAKKARIRQSRVGGTHLLATALAGLPESERPAVLINASAIGYYGDRPGDQPLSEEAAPGDTFMARVVRDWEAATTPARDAEMRVVRLRFGLVLDPEGLLLQAVSLASRFGLGATLGPGTQPFPWVTRAEIADVTAFVMDEAWLEGPVNVVAPERVTHAEFVDCVAAALDRPRFLRIPSPIVRLAGDLGDELLTGAWVVPERLREAGYQWRDPALEPALRRMLGKQA
jgi:uncharacterized protein